MCGALDAEAVRPDHPGAPRTHENRYLDRICTIWGDEQTELTAGIVLAPAFEFRSDGGGL